MAFGVHIATSLSFGCHAGYTAVQPLSIDGVARLTRLTGGVDCSGVSSAGKLKSYPQGRRPESNRNLRSGLPFGCLHLQRSTSELQRHGSAPHFRGARRDKLPEVPLAAGGVGSIIIIIIKNRMSTSLFHIAYLLLIFSAGRNRTDICALSQRRFFSYSGMGVAAQRDAATIWGKEEEREVRRGGTLPTSLLSHIFNAPFPQLVYLLQKILPTKQVIGGHFKEICYLNQ